MDPIGEMDKPRRPFMSGSAGHGDTASGHGVQIRAANLVVEQVMCLEDGVGFSALDLEGS